MMISNIFVQMLVSLIGFHSFLLVSAANKKTNEDSSLFNDDSLFPFDTLEALRLRVEPTPIVLTNEQSISLMNDVIVAVDEYMLGNDYASSIIDYRNSNFLDLSNISDLSKTFGRRSLTDNDGLRVRSQTRHLSNNSSMLPATILEIEGMIVRYNTDAGRPSDSGLVKDLISDAVQSSFNAEPNGMSTSSTKSSTSHANESHSFRVQLTWQSQFEALPPVEEALPPGEEALPPGEEALTPGEETLPTGEEVLTPGEETLPTGEEVLLPVASDTVKTPILIDDTAKNSNNHVLRNTLFLVFSCASLIGTSLVLARRREQRITKYRHGAGIENEGLFGSENVVFPVVSFPVQVDNDESEVPSLSLYDSPSSRYNLGSTLNRVNNSDIYLGTVEGLDFLGGDDARPSGGLYPFLMNRNRDPTSSTPRILLSLADSLLSYSSSSESGSDSLLFCMSRDSNTIESISEVEEKSRNEKLMNELELISSEPMVTKNITEHISDGMYDVGVCNVDCDDQSSLGLPSIS